VIAANLAVSLGRTCRVALLDCSLQFGDIGILLNITAERTIADLAANNAVADHDVVEDVMVDGRVGCGCWPPRSAPSWRTTSPPST